MNILYNDAITFEPLDPFVKISKFKYYDKTQVTDDDKHESFEQFIQDVHDVKSGKYDFRNQGGASQHCSTRHAERRPSRELRRGLLALQHGVQSG